MKKLVLILPVLVLLLGGCGLVIPSAGPHHGEITFRLVDGETGEPLEGGYVFTNETWTACMKGIMTFGWQTTNYGNHQVWELSNEGEVTLPEYGYEVLRAEVYVKGYEKARFNLIRSSLFSGLKLDISLQKSELPEEYAQAEGFGPAIPVDKRHYKIPLKDITSDSEGWYRKIRDFRGSFGSYLINMRSGEDYEYLNEQMINEIYQTVSEETKQYVAKYNNKATEQSRLLQKYLDRFQRKLIKAQWEADTPKWNNFHKLKSISENTGTIKVGILDSASKTQDKFGHGTYASEIIKNFCPNCNIVPVKILNDNGYGEPEKLAEGIKKAMSKQVEIIYIGSGFYRDSVVVKSAIEKASKHGKIIVAPAGNDGVSQPFYPAAYTEVVGIGSYGKDGKNIGHNYGNWIDACAPGEDIYGYDGTSGAAAITTGLFANELSGNQKIDWNSKQSFKVLKKCKKVEGDQGISGGYRVDQLKAQWGVETHKALTGAALKNSIGLNYPEIYDEIALEESEYYNQLLQGSKDEDELTLGMFGLGRRYFNHFWHKKMNRELTYFSSFVESDARTWGLKHSDNHYRWEDAIQRYGYTNDTKRQSYYTLGFVAHLTQDMLVPEHVHDDPHAKDPLFNSGDPSTFEDFVKEQLSGNDDYINALADDSIADITSPYKAFADGNEFGYKQNLFDPEPDLSRTDEAVRDNAFGIGEYTVKLETDVPAPRKATSEGKVI